MPKITIGITGLLKISGRDYGIEERYRRPSYQLRRAKKGHALLYPAQFKIRIQKLLLLLEYIIYIELSAWEVSSCRIFVQHMGSRKIRLFSSQRLLYRRVFCETRVSHDTHSIMRASQETTEEIII